MKKYWKYLTAFLLGVLSLSSGLYMVKTLREAPKFLSAIQYVLIGLGCVLFGYGMGKLVEVILYKRNPEIGRMVEIEKNDERNRAVSDSAKARAYDLMTYVFAALLISFALMQVDNIPIILLAFSYIFIHIYAIWNRSRIEKEM